MLKKYEIPINQYIVPNLYISWEKPNIDMADVKLAIIDMATGKVFKKSHVFT